MRVLRQVAQHADDLDRAVEFYRDTLGLPFLARFDPPGLAFLDLGGVRLLLERTAAPCVLYLASDDLDAEVERLRAKGVEIIAEPCVIFADDDGVFGPPGETIRMAFFRDSEGNVVGLTSP
jgi:methylmalonyl-CoA/ethylmalonyl-CoA epimerase